MVPSSMATATSVKKIARAKAPTTSAPAPFVRAATKLPLVAAPISSSLA